LLSGMGMTTAARVMGFSKMSSIYLPFRQSIGLVLRLAASLRVLLRQTTVN
jgi:hypothetical protein